MSAPTIVLLRFAEPDAAVLPSDELGALVDLNLDTGVTLPTVTSSFTGYARRFASGTGLTATDAVPGTSLATRDCSVQCLVRIDVTAQAAAGGIGTIIARGKGNTAAEYVAYAVEVRIVNAALRIAELRWWWQTVAGVVVAPIGGHFVVPNNGFVMLTATRKWLATSKVVCRYYAGDLLIGETLSTSGDIGGGTTGTTCIGTRYSAGVAGRFFCGDIDELRIVRGELAPEEIAATWDRIAVRQPAGYRLLRDLMPPDLPVSSDASSQVQRFLRVLGHGLGYADGQDQNFRANFVPTRAYGDVLEAWETITKESPRALDDLATRRQRVAAHLAQRAGSSPDGITAALATLLAVGPSQLEILAFSNRIVDNFATTLDPLRWTRNVDAPWSISSGQVRCLLAAADYQFTGTLRNWRFCAMASEGNTFRSKAIGDVIDSVSQVKVTPSTVPNAGEAGLFIGDISLGNYILLGLRNDAGTYKIVREQFFKFASLGEVVVVASAVDHWLRIGSNKDSNLVDFAKFDLGWSTVGPSSGFTFALNVEHPSLYQWTGMYCRSFGGSIASTMTARFDDWISVARRGQRPNTWYVYRDPSLPGTPDLTGAERTLRRLKQSHTDAHVCTAKIALCDDLNTGCDRTPMGAI